MVIREKQQVEVKKKEDGTPVMRERVIPVVLHCDIIRDEPFWVEHPGILS